MEIVLNSLKLLMYILGGVVLGLLAVACATSMMFLSMILSGGEFTLAVAVMLAIGIRIYFLMRKSEHLI